MQTTGAASGADIASLVSTRDPKIVFEILQYLLTSRQLLKDINNANYDKQDTFDDKVAEGYMAARRATQIGQGTEELTFEETLRCMSWCRNELNGSRIPGDMAETYQDNRSRDDMISVLQVAISALVKAFEEIPDKPSSMAAYLEMVRRQFEDLHFEDSEAGGWQKALSRVRRL